MRDQQLLEAIMEELDWDSRVDATNLDIRVEGNVVTLQGSVGSYAEKLAAEEAVRRVKGVQAVNQNIEVKTPAEQTVSDDETAKRLHALLVWDPMVPGHLIQVKVKKGWVTLTGEVPSQYQRRRAADCANNLVGVTGVSNLISIAPTAGSVEIKKQIENAMRRNADADLSDLRVSIEDEKVTLEGQVRTWRQHDLVGDIAWLTPGVRTVVNRIQVVPDLATPGRRDSE